MSTDADKPIATTKSIDTYSEFKDDIMPPNKNPMSALQNMVHDSTENNVVVTSKCNTQLQEVVSEVMRSAAMQSQQKTPTASKSRISSLLSSSKPLVPVNYTAAKPLMSSSNNTSDKMTTIQPRINNLSRLSQKQLTLSERESEMFLSRANKQDEHKVRLSISKINMSCFLYCIST